MSTTDPRAREKTTIPIATSLSSAVIHACCNRTAITDSETSSRIQERHHMMMMMPRMEEPSTPFELLAAESRLTDRRFVWIAPIDRQREKHDVIAKANGITVCQLLQANIWSSQAIARMKNFDLTRSRLMPSQSHTLQFRPYQELVHSQVGY